jgi:hypothetical protein
MAEKERTTSGACGSASVDESKKIWVGGANVGISNWSGIVEEVRKLKLKDDERVSEELLKRVKKNDFVPKSKEGEYRKVLLEEFKNSP